MRWKLLLLIILLLPQVLAISTNMKPAYSKGETMIIEISGDIREPISSSDIQFKRSHVEVPFVYDVKRLGEKYYLYALAPTSENNYTLFINDISTTLNGIPARINFNQTFSVLNETIPYSINPGFATFKGNFEFKVFLYKDASENISIDFPEAKEIFLRPGENTIPIDPSNSEPGFRIIQIGSYSVPIFILENTPEIKLNETEFRLFPVKIESTILAGDKSSYSFRIINDGDYEISDGYFEYNSSLFEIIPNLISPIPANSSLSFNVTTKTTNTPILSSIFFKSSYAERELIINFTYTNNSNQTFTSYYENQTSSNRGYYCAELQGDFCASNQKCSTDLVESLDGPCCTGACKVQEESSFSWIGWLIGAVVLIILIFIFLKYRKTKSNKINPLASRLPRDFTPKI